MRLISGLSAALLSLAALDAAAGVIVPLPLGYSVSAGIVNAGPNTKYVGADIYNASYSTYVLTAAGRENGKPVAGAVVARPAGPLPGLDVVAAYFGASPAGQRTRVSVCTHQKCFVNVTK